MNDRRPFFLSGRAEDIEDFRELIFLKGDVRMPEVIIMFLIRRMMMMMVMMMVGVWFSLVALENGAQADELGHDAADGPQVDCRGVVAPAE